jgi:hypothetical protein
MNRGSGRSSGFAQQAGCSGFPFPGALDADRKRSENSQELPLLLVVLAKAGIQGLQGCGQGPLFKPGGRPWTPAFKLGHARILPGRWGTPLRPSGGRGRGPRPTGPRRARPEDRLRRGKVRWAGDPPGIPHLTPALSAPRGPRGGEGDAVSSAAPHCHEMCMRLRFRRWRR